MVKLTNIWNPNLKYLVENSLQPKYQNFGQKIKHFGQKIKNFGQKIKKISQNIKMGEEI